MAKTAVLNIRTNPETKKAVERLFSQIGITISDAVNIFFNKSLMVSGIPFDVTVNVPNAETIAAIEEARAMLKDPATRKFSSVEELIEELNSDD